LEQLNNKDFTRLIEDELENYNQLSEQLLACIKRLEYLSNLPEDNHFLELHVANCVELSNRVKNAIRVHSFIKQKNDKPTLLYLYTIIKNNEYVRNLGATSRAQVVDFFNKYGYHF